MSIIKWLRGSGSHSCIYDWCWLSNILIDRVPKFFLFIENTGVIGWSVYSQTYCKEVNIWWRGPGDPRRSSRQREAGIRNSWQDRRRLLCHVYQGKPPRDPHSTGQLWKATRTSTKQRLNNLNVTVCMISWLGSTPCKPQFNNCSGHLISKPFYFLTVLLLAHLWIYFSKWLCIKSKKIWFSWCLRMKCQKKKITLQNCEQDHLKKNALSYRNIAAVHQINQWSWLMNDTISQKPRNAP